MKQIKGLFLALMFISCINVFAQEEKLYDDPIWVLVILYG